MDAVFQFVVENDSSAIQMHTLTSDVRRCFVFRLQPGDIRGYLNMARLLTTAGRVPEAEEVYRRARSLLPSASQAKQGKVTVTQTHLQIFLNLAVLIAANNSRYEEADDVSSSAKALFRFDFCTFVGKERRFLKLF